MSKMLGKEWKKITFGVAVALLIVFTWQFLLRTERPKIVIITCAIPPELQQLLDKAVYVPAGSIESAGSIPLTKQQASEVDPSKVVEAYKVGDIDTNLYSGQCNLQAVFWFSGKLSSFGLNTNFNVTEEVPTGIKSDFGLYTEGNIEFYKDRFERIYMLNRWADNAGRVIFSIGLGGLWFLMACFIFWPKLIQWMEKTKRKKEKTAK